jgi:hypothetical protein
MPQTISLQRGTVTLSNNTSTLLFTATASGTATRVIPGYLSYQSDFSTVYGYCTFGILRNGASSPNFVIIGATYPGSPARQVSLSPHDTASGWHGQGTSTTENVPVLVQTSTAGPIQTSAMNQGSPIMGWFNRNIMIGPSDAFYCAWSDNGGGNRSAVVEYCFTLITE